MRTDVSDDKISAIWQQQTNPMFSEAERAALDLALAAGSCPPSVGDGHFDRLRQHFSDDEIVEIVAVIAMFGRFNRWNDTMGNDLEEGPENFKRDLRVASGSLPACGHCRRTTPRQIALGARLALPYA